MPQHLNSQWRADQTDLVEALDEITHVSADWVKGVPTKTVTDPNGLKLTKTTGYDSQGRAISTSLPKSTGTDAGRLTRDIQTVCH